MAEAPKKKNEPREYLVFENPPEGTKVTASNPEQAMRLAAAEKGGGSFAAVPVNNWHQIEFRSVPQPPALVAVPSSVHIQEETPEDIQEQRDQVREEAQRVIA